jgi:hypothetical protein
VGPTWRWAQRGDRWRAAKQRSGGPNTATGGGRRGSVASIGVVQRRAELCGGGPSVTTGGAGRGAVGPVGCCDGGSLRIPRECGCGRPSLLQNAAIAIVCPGSTFCASGVVWGIRWSQSNPFFLQPYPTHYPACRRPPSCASPHRRRLALAERRRLRSTASLFQSPHHTQPAASLVLAPPPHRRRPASPRGAQLAAQPGQRGGQDRHRSLKIGALSSSDLFHALGSCRFHLLAHVPCPYFHLIPES